MKFDVVLSKPIVTKQKNGLYTVIVALPPEWKVEKHENLTYEDALALPYISEIALALLG